MPRYRAVRRVSTRRRPDPTCEEWITYEPGDAIVKHPKHLPLAELLADGAIKKIEE